MPIQALSCSDSVSSSAKDSDYLNPFLRSGFDDLDRALGPYLTPGRLTEWGLPHGLWGRLLPALMLRSFRQSVLWIKDEGAQLYPQSLQALGVDLKNLYLINCDQPLKKLRPLFLDESFSVIVLDTSQRLLAADFSFLAARARIHQSCIFILRPFFLKPEKGNPFAAARLNVQYRFSRNQFFLQFIKGHQCQSLQLSLAEIFEVAL